jgi:FkbM family methyltransferase
MIDLAKILQDHHHPMPQVIWEVGANHPNQVHVAPLIESAERVELFEPHPYFAGELRKHFAADKKVTIHEVALGDQNGPRVLRDDGCSSYLDGVASPRASIGVEPGGTVGVLCRTVDYYDRGDIDLLAIDTEGSEWPVIQGLISRPRLICVEMGWQHYRNPHADEIRAWMAAQGYRMLETDGQDEVYVR